MGVWMLVVQFANAIIMEGNRQPLLVMLGCTASLLLRLLALLNSFTPTGADMRPVFFRAPLAINNFSNIHPLS